MSVGQFHWATDKQEAPDVSGAFFGAHLARAYSVWRAPGPFKPQGFRRYPDDLNSSLLHRLPPAAPAGIYMRIQPLEEETSPRRHLGGAGIVGWTLGRF